LRGDGKSKPDKLGKVEFLNSELKTSNPQVWTPFNQEINPSLKKLFAYDAMPPLSAGLMDVLYTEQEKIEKLNHGFIGHPSIGAAVMTNTIKLLKENPWKDFCAAIKNDEKAHIFLFGSIFGGTGAAGLPTLARLLVNEFSDRTDNFRLGCALMLPYFSCPPAPNNSQNLQIKSDEFLLKSQAALNYYQEKLGEQYKSVYILGEPNNRSQVETYQTGSALQRNPAHFLELYAATAALDFFEQDFKEGIKTYKVARQNTNELKWDSLSGGERLELKLASLARFSYAYLGYFYQQIGEQRNKNRGLLSGISLPTWYKTFLKKDWAIIQDSLDRVANYCESFLGWLGTMHLFTQEPFKVSLFDTNTYEVTADENTFYKVNIPHDRLDNLYRVSNNRQVAFKFSQLSGGLDRWSPKFTEAASEVGCFIHALYKVCQIDRVQENPLSAQGQTGNILLLPNRKTGSNVSAIDTPSSAGVWVGDTGVALGKLAQCLDVQQLKDNIRSIDSIPDVWARPLLFKTALFNDTHPLHTKAKTEWRGLLAMLALKERLCLPLYIKPLAVTKDSPSDFVKVVYQLRPTAELDTDWTEVNLLFYGSEPQSSQERGDAIGMTSPATLVCTTAELKGLPDDRVPWVQNGILSDPCKCDDVDKNALRYWLSELKGNELLIKYGESKIGHLARSIDEFMKDLSE
jgi:hypothetical protein